MAWGNDAEIETHQIPLPGPAASHMNGAALPHWRTEMIFQMEVQSESTTARGSVKNITIVPTLTS